MILKVSFVQRSSSIKGLVISQRKYALDILNETNMIDCKSMDSPMDLNKILMAEQGEVFSNPQRYRRLVRKPIYLIITIPKANGDVL